MSKLFFWTLKSSFALRKPFAVGGHSPALSRRSACFLSQSLAFCQFFLLFDYFLVITTVKNSKTCWNPNKNISNEIFKIVPTEIVLKLLIKTWEFLCKLHIEILIFWYKIIMLANLFEFSCFFYSYETPCFRNFQIFCFLLNYLLSNSSHAVEQ